MQSMGWHFRSGLWGQEASSSRGNKAQVIHSRVESFVCFESGEEEESIVVRVPGKTSRESQSFKQVADFSKAEWKAFKQRQRNRSRFMQTGVWLKKTTIGG